MFYNHDLVIFADSMTEIEERLNIWTKMLYKYGPKRSIYKCWTHYHRTKMKRPFNANDVTSIKCPICINRPQKTLGSKSFLEIVDTFKYLDDVQDSKGSTDASVAFRTKQVWSSFNACKNIISCEFLSTILAEKF